MLVNGQDYRTIWLAGPGEVHIIDQRWLPHEFRIERIRTVEQMAMAIQEMHLRGAPLIGAAAAWGMYLAACQGMLVAHAYSMLAATRPTAVDLFHALDRSRAIWQPADDPIAATQLVAETITEESVQACQRIGQFGVPILRKLYEKHKERPLQILTHCNAGWLACVDYGTATAPIYAAQAAGIPVHVWVDETRPRNQGARLTAFELREQGIPHTVIADNTGGLLMQRGEVDAVIVGSDRTTRSGDVANKIGTYLKALAAQDNGIPFYVALPTSSFDWNIESGADIPIEKRAAQEVTHIQGRLDDQLVSVQLTPDESPALNYGFDVTPARMVTGLITDRGVCNANAESIASLFADLA